MNLCETLCIQCTEKGKFPLNFSGYHKVCASHIPTNTPFLICARCDSEVIPVQEFLFCAQCGQPEIVQKCVCGSLLCSYCQVLCSSCSQGYCSNCLPSSSRTCKPCEEFNKAHCPKCKESNEIICLSCNTHNCNPNFTRCKKCKKKTCVDCINISNTCPSCCNSSVTFSARGKNKPIMRELKCSICNSNKNIVKGNCEHLFCSDCSNNECRLCTGSKTMSTRRGRNEAVSNIKMNKFCACCKRGVVKLNKFELCDECFNDFIGSKPDSKAVCLNCGETEGSKNNFSCKHEGCSICTKKNTFCYKCYKKRRQRASLEAKNCAFCNKKIFCFSLFCEHYCCLKCASDFSIKKLDFVCINCLFTSNKRCLKCRKFTIWEHSEKNKYFESLCCEKKVCKICYKPESFFGCFCSLKKN